MIEQEMYEKEFHNTITSLTTASTNIKNVDKKIMTENKKEAVNHPQHYGGVDNPYEVIKIIEHYNLDFSTGNCLKYILRAGIKNKETILEDFEKALWYLNRKIKNIKNE